MPEVVEKSHITKVCVDDFAFRKRYTYGTVMVDLVSHRIVGIIDSRGTHKVEKWLETFPNLEVISRDGAQTYSSAARNSHPTAIQVSDRFHLLKALSEAAEKYMRTLFPSRLEIPLTSGAQSPEMQALYNTRNRTERILFAQQKRREGYTVNDIALLLHSSASTISKYLAIAKKDIPELKENACEAQHTASIRQKQAVIEEVKRLAAEGRSLDEISRLTGHVYLTIKNYLKEGSAAVKTHYDYRVPGKLAPYEQEVIQMRSKGMTYVKIHEVICKKGYNGTVASLRVFMQKERTRHKQITNSTKASVGYIPRKFMCQLIYRSLEKVKGLTQEQYDAALDKYPVLSELYSLLRGFHRIMFSQKADELEGWMDTAATLKIDESDSYIAGIQKDLEAVKNGINYSYNNGLAEGSVNKIKLIKRIMYGRDSFQLLKAKILLNEHYFN